MGSETSLGSGASTPLTVTTSPIPSLPSRGGSNDTHQLGAAAAAGAGAQAAKVAGSAGAPWWGARASGRSTSGVLPAPNSALPSLLAQEL